MVKANDQVDTQVNGKGADTISTEHYDKSLLVKGMKSQDMGYGGPEELVSLMEKHKVDKNSHIIDIVAGSGILGMTLKNHGYTKLEGLDGSQKMLDIAKERNIYEKYHCELLEPNQATSLPQRSFDIAIASGCFAPGHLNPDHFLPIINLVKKGGKAFFAINDKYVKD